MSKSSLEYTELAGLRIFLAHYSRVFSPSNLDNNIDSQLVISIIQQRIKELEDK